MLFFIIQYGAVVDFLENFHKIHPISRPLGWGMGCILCVNILIHIPSHSLQWCMQYYLILYGVIIAPQCIYEWSQQNIAHVTTVMLFCKVLLWSVEPISNRALQIFNNFEIRSKYCQWDERQVLSKAEASIVIILNQFTLNDSEPACLVEQACIKLGIKNISFDIIACSQKEASLYNHALPTCRVWD